MYIEDFIKITINPNSIQRLHHCRNKVHSIPEMKIEMIGLLSHMRLGDVWANYIHDKEAKGPTKLLEFIIAGLDT